MRTVIRQPQLRARLRVPLLASVSGVRLGPRILPILGLLLVFAFLTWVGLLQLRTPDVAPATAPATEFSAERAMEHLQVIAAEPRPAGSPDHLATRQYLIDQLRAMGLEPQVQSTTVVVPGEGGAEGFGAGAVENVIARIPGTDNSGAIAIDAHYDTGATGPGAMDAGAGVVATLETVRAIQAGPALKNDVIIVFADGEEAGMLGAAAFNQHHPWADEIKLALNFEGAGGNGAALLYATSQHNDWIVSEFLKVAPDPAGYSLLPTIVHLYPDGRLDCDLGEYTERGSSGLGFVSIGDTPAYHTVRDNPDLIDPGSIQQMGGYTLASVQHFGNLDLTELPQSGDRVFFNVLPGVVVHYAAGWVIPLAVLISALVISLLFIGFRTSELTSAGVALGVVAALLGTVGVTLIAVLVWAAIRLLTPDYQVMLIGTYQSSLYVIALIFVTIAAMTALYTLLGRRTRRYNLAAGALLGSLLPLWFASLTVPGMSYLVAWPVLFATLPLAWTLLAGKRAANPWWRLTVLAIAVVPATILMPGTLYAMVGLANRLEGLMGIPVLGVVMVFVAPLVTLLGLHLDFLSGRSGWRRWAVPITAALAAIVLIGWGNANSSFDTEHPRPDRIAYELNADTGQARWISRDQRLDAWTTQFFPAEVGRVDHESLITGTVGAYVTQAPVVRVPGPEVDVISDTHDGGVRTLDLRLASDGARVMATKIIAPGEIVALAVDGQSVNPREYGWMADGEFPVIYQNVPIDGWHLSISFRSSESLTLELEAVTDDLPEMARATFEPRPPEMMPAPDFARDPTIVKKTIRF